MKVVLDSNILISAFLASQGEDANVLKQSKKQTLYLSPFIISESLAGSPLPTHPEKLPFLGQCNRLGREIESKRLSDLKYTKGHHKVFADDWLFLLPPLSLFLRSM